MHETHSIISQSSFHQKYTLPFKIKGPTVVKVVAYILIDQFVIFGDESDSVIDPLQRQAYQHNG
jgi:hypothetical protein